MIDNFAILFSALMVMFIVIQAARMDRARPWFETRSLHEQEEKRDAERRARRKARIELPLPDGLGRGGPAKRR